MKPLPPAFALNCPNDCWLVVAPHYDPPDRQHLQPADCALTVAANDVPLVPQLPPVGRSIPRWPA
jgi:hypothetical protein